MRASAELELLVGSRGEVTKLLSPGVGLFTAARAAGDLLAPGASAGVLFVLGKAFELVVPRGVEGRVRTPPPARTRQPVGWGDLLYEVEASAAGAKPAEETGVAVGRAEALAPDGAAGAWLVRSPQSGRFYLRPGPGDEAFAPPGATVEAGQPMGLIEVMKTFAHVRYPTEGLPARARVVRVLVEDGAEIAAGEPLFEVAPV
jgi:acetyl-CoA carboxylase biotin carboxyl carrier protein